MRYTCILLVFLLTTGLTGEIYGVSDGAFSAAPGILQNDPVFSSYRGVSLGMPADEVRKILGKSRDQSDAEDMFEPEDNESARIFYDQEKKVRAISVTYSGDISKAPLPKAVVGSNITANEDGGMFKRVEYQKQGFWISYVKLAGDNPMVMITLQAL